MNLPEVFLKMWLAGTACCAGLDAHSQPAAPAATAPEAQVAQAPGVDPAVMAAMDRMATFLRGLRSFELNVSTLTDEMLDGEQTAQLGRTGKLKVRRPDGLQADLSNDRGDRKLLYYNGRTTTVFGPQTKYYATVPAPDTLAGVVDILSGRYGIDLPGADLFYWDSKGFAPGQFRSAEFLGVAMVDGSETDQFAFRQEGVDWQIWVQRGKSPLPRKLVITTTVLAAKPQHSMLMRWNLSPKFSDSDFNFKPQAGAQRIVIQKVDGTVDSTGQ